MIDKIKPCAADLPLELVASCSYWAFREHRALFAAGPVPQVKLG